MSQIRTKQANVIHICVCGRRIRGNAFGHHKKSCEQWKAADPATRVKTVPSFKFY